jgi:hypothetical protein
VVRAVRSKRESQFPIEDDRDNFNARKTGKHPSGHKVQAYLRGVSALQCQLTGAVQPYKLKALNPDEERAGRASSDPSRLRASIGSSWPSTV